MNVQLSCSCVAVTDVYFVVGSDCNVDAAVVAVAGFSVVEAAPLGMDSTACRRYC